MPKYRSGKLPVCVQETGLMHLGCEYLDELKEAEVDQIMLMAIMTILQLTVVTNTLVNYLSPCQDQTWLPFHL